MAQIVINIPDKTYKAFMELISINLGRSNYKGITMKCLNAIKHGKVLPKGHGDLIDVDTIVWDEEYEMASDGSYIVMRTPIIDTAITVIKADKEGKKDEKDDL